MILLKHFTLNKKLVIVMFVFGDKTIRMKGRCGGRDLAALKKPAMPQSGLFILYSMASIPIPSSTAAPLHSSL